MAPKTSDFVLEADNSIRLQSGSVVVGGDLGARGMGSGPFLSGGVSIDVLTGVQVTATRSLIADSVRLGTGVAVGDVQTNRFVDGTGAQHGSVTGLVPLPALPIASAVAPGTANLTVATLSASPGSYANVTVGTGGKLRLAAGAYDLANLTMSTGARLEVLGSRVRSGHTIDSWDRKAIGRAAGSPGRVRRWAVTWRRNASMDLRSEALAAQSSVTRIEESLTVT
jgi:hypothetical protein